jgi:hypothetical protein
MLSGKIKCLILNFENYFQDIIDVTKFMVDQR